MKRREALALGGTALVGTSLLSLLNSCKEESRLSWQPSFLSKDHALLISALIDTILPKTDTPGGLDVKADIFIDKVYKHMYSTEAQNAIVTEMNAFNDKAKAAYGKVFHQLNSKQKEEFLRKEEASSPKFGGQVWGTSVGDQPPVGFYRSFKSTAIWAYCTTQEIGKNVLNYDPLPGDYKGCIPLQEVGKVWSL